MLANFSKRNLFFGDLSLMLPAHFQYTKPPLVKRFFFFKEGILLKKDTANNMSALNYSRLITYKLVSITYNFFMSQLIVFIRK